MKRIVLAGFLIMCSLNAQAADFTINSKTAKTVPVDADLILAADSAATPQWALKKITLNDLKTYIGVGTGTIPNGSAVNQIIQWNGSAWAVTSSVAGLIDDTATDGDDDALWSANKTYDSIVTAITGKTVEIASSTATLGTAAIADGACATAVTVTATGTATTDVISWGFNSDPTAVTGYNPTGGLLYIVAYPTAGNVNFKVCNKSGASITPGAITLNWRIDR